MPRAKASKSGSPSIAPPATEESGEGSTPSTPVSPAVPSSSKPAKTRKKSTSIATTTVNDYVLDPLHPQATVSSLLNAHRLLCVTSPKGKAEQDPAIPFSQAVRELEEELSRLGDRLQASDTVLTTRQMEAALALFDPSDLQLARTAPFADVDILLTRLGRTKPLRLEGGTRLDRTQFEKKLEDAPLSTLRGLVRQYNFKFISLQVGGTGKRTKNHIANELLDAAMELHPKFQAEFFETTFSTKLSLKDTTTRLNADEASNIEMQLFGAAGRVDLRLDGFAVKCARNKRSQRNMQREVAVARRIIEAGGHPNVVFFESVSAVEHKVTMEALCYTFGDLEDKHESDDPSIPKLDRLVLLLDLARALDFLHRDLRIIHNDIKLDNVMIGGDGRARLIDFESSLDEITQEQFDAGERHSSYSASSSVDPSLSLRGGQFTFDVDVCQWAFLAERMLRETKWAKNDVLFAERGGLFDRCTTRKYLERPSMQKVCEELEKLLVAAKIKGWELPTDTKYRMVYRPPTSAGESQKTSTAEPSTLLLAHEAKATQLAHDPVVGGCCVRIATFNIRNLSAKRNDRLTGLATFVVSNRVDIVALQECRRDDFADELVELLNAATPQPKQEPFQQAVWSCRMSTPSRDSKHCYEVFVFRQLTTGSQHDLRCMAAERVPATQDGEEAWTRDPFFGKFRVGKTRFVIGNVHLLPTAKKPELQVPRLAEQLDRGLCYDANQCTVMEMGDFNLPADDEAFDALRKVGFRHLLPVCVKTNKEATVQYDNVFWRSPFGEQAGAPRVMGIRRLDDVPEIDSDHHAVMIEHSYNPGLLEGATKPLSVG